MPVKKEACRNFQRGFCQYGERCKFLHGTPQQSKPNVFESRPTSQFQPTSSQQQMPNPFGFGVQNSSMLKGPGPGPADFRPKPQQNNFFGNKWTRPTTSSSDSQSQSAANNHKCTDPESCKRQIIEDLEHERPLWKLTCYSHSKNAPCDVFGDISYEELRSVAYDDAKRGLNLQSIVERERGLLNSKIIEFEYLLRNPYTIPTNSTFGIQTQTPGPTPSPFSVGHRPSSSPSWVSSFSQLAPTTPPNMGFGPRPDSIAQSNPFQSISQSSGPFGTSFPSSGVLPQASAPASSQPHTHFSMPNSVSVADAPLAGPAQGEIDASIWMKQEWIPGEIPEEAPPQIYCR